MSDRGLVPLKTELTLRQAETVIDAALAAGRAAGMQPLTVAVLDAGGQLKALKREDGSGLLRPDIAIGKAWAALGMGISTRTIQQRLDASPNFLTALSAASGGRFVPVPGGVLIRDAEGRAIGAVGISGDNSANDEIAALAGVKAAGLRPHPEG